MCSQPEMSSWFMWFLLQYETRVIDMIFLLNLNKIGQWFSISLRSGQNVHTHVQPNPLSYYSLQYHRIL
jgi:hypothetical protein